MDAADVFIPIVMLLVMAGIGYAFLYYNHQNKHDINETVRKSLEQGKELPQEVLDSLNRSRPSSESDLRKAVLLIMLGLATVVFGVFIIDESTATGIGIFPIFVGLGYLINAKLFKG